MFCYTYLHIKKTKKGCIFLIVSTLNHCLSLVIYDTAAVNAFKDVEKAAQCSHKVVL